MNENIPIDNSWKLWEYFQAISSYWRMLPPRILSNRPLQAHSPNFKLTNIMLKHIIELDQKAMRQPAHEAIMHPLVNIFRTTSQQCWYLLPYTTCIALTIPNLHCTLLTVLTILYTIYIIQLTRFASLIVAVEVSLEHKWATKILVCQFFNKTNVWLFFRNTIKSDGMSIHISPI